MPELYILPDPFDNLVSSLAAEAVPASADALRDLEDSHRKLGQALEGALTARVISNAHADRKLVQLAIDNAQRKFGLSLKNKGLRKVTVRLKGGEVLRVRTPYFCVPRPPAYKKHQFNAQQRTSKRACYPVLEQLGILDRLTPMARQEIAHTVVSAQSYEEANSVLSRMGLQLNIKTVVSTCLSVARELKLVRSELFEQTMEEPVFALGPLTGRDILVSLDGGRAHMREPYQSGRRKKNGRRGFEANWREPKGLVIQVLDDQGKPDPAFRPFYDMTMSDADGVFALLTRYLRLFGATYARRLIFVADGADWIWNRVDVMLEMADIDPEKVFKLVDFYHACEHLKEAIDLRKFASKKERERMFHRLKRQLLKGQIQQVLNALEKYADLNDPDDPMLGKTQYFKNRIHLMDYARVRAEGLPIGSGSMESAVRRVLNLRFKGAGLLWRHHNLEALMHIRALVKAGRWFKSERETYLGFRIDDSEGDAYQMAM